LQEAEDEEAAAFRERLEQRYPLCGPCEAAVTRHLAQQERSRQASWMAAMLKNSRNAPLAPPVPVRAVHGWR